MSEQRLMRLYEEHATVGFVIAVVGGVFAIIFSALAASMNISLMYLSGAMCMVVAILGVILNRKSVVRYQELERAYNRNNFFNWW